MSGGSFDYMYSKDFDDINLGHLLRACDLFRENGWNDVATATKVIVLSYFDKNFQYDETVDAIRKVWKALEWYDNNDWGFDALDEAVSEFRSNNGVQRAVARLSKFSVT